ncbi:branched-chain amino acid ABC transporter permease [Spongiactinospora gelatinilytica]|uniref:Branched-chain amino acid ABC transporter permease n=1 Tax=Spongiactinospora gelatinilytica TaxID=2666298 RepID=A0A2W2I127_9ACTN|nr:branched-chain amino acid ABC transporter permease [Spongiactinospora gelatinilytica]
MFKAALTSSKQARAGVRWRVPVAVVAGVVLLAIPLYADRFWLNLGSFAFAAAIGAVGLMILVGRVGQLSLAHSFFLAVGAYGYIWLSSPATEESWGLGLPSLAAAVVAVALAGLAGLAFSPLAGRLKGIYLGVASLALVFIGQHVLFTAEPLTGGYNGRNVPELSIGSFQVFGVEPELSLFGVPLRQAERGWYVTLLILALTTVFAVLVLRSRVGRAFAAIRDGEVHAAALGVRVARYRSVAFTLSSVYAGLAGVLLALLFERVVPEYWDLFLSLEYLAMVVIGGQASVAGAIAGAAFVSSLPLLLQRYSDAIPGMGGAVSNFGPAYVAQILYGGMIVLILFYEPKGLAALATRARKALTPRRPVAADRTPAA